ncbi:hypothetical protein KAT63_05360 [Candidatus Parcubacteria bacterium]|nr:hypothetical protein [Candidatus Parcubacteria bacterium]
MALLIKKGSAKKEEINFVGVSIGVDRTFRLLFVDREIWFDSEDGDFLYNEIKKFYINKNKFNKIGNDTEVSDEQLLKTLGYSDKEINKL